MVIGGVRAGVVSGGDIEIPDSVVSLYEYEDDSDTTTAIDSVGSNDANISGATYSTTAKVGSLALDHDGANDETTSQTAVDLSAAGSTDGFGFGGWMYPRSLSSGGYLYTHEAASTDYAGIQDTNTAGNIRAVLRVGGDTVTGTEVSIPTGQWTHVYQNVTQSDIELYVDGTQASIDAHTLDITTIGSGNHRTGKSAASAAFADPITDDFAPANDPLSGNEINDLIARAN